MQCGVLISYLTPTALNLPGLSLNTLLEFPTCEGLVTRANRNYKLLAADAHEHFCYVESCSYAAGPIWFAGCNVHLTAID
jgi:hypothetical protein